MKRQVLPDEVTKKFAKVVKEFMDVVQDNCDDYAFYRGKVYATEEDKISLEFLGSNISGNPKFLEATYDADKDVMYYSKRFSLNNEEAVIKSLVKLVSFIERVKTPISVLRFDVSTSYKFALATPSPVDPGCAIVSMIGNFFKDVEHHEITYDLHLDHYTGDLTEDWTKDPEEVKMGAVIVPRSE